MDHDLASQLLTSVRTRFRDYKTLGDRALAQCANDVLIRVIAPGSNSIAVIVRHVSGNLRSRWTDFLISDGEKPDRQRDEEFLDPHVSRDQLLQWWEEGWRICLTTLDALTPADLTKTITIRGQPLTVVDAINRSLAHTSYHVGQIVLLAKTFLAANWQTLSIPRGQSDTYTTQIKQQY